MCSAGFRGSRGGREMCSAGFRGSRGGREMCSAGFRGSRVGKEMCSAGFRGSRVGRCAVQGSGGAGWGDVQCRVQGEQGREGNVQCRVQGEQGAKFMNDITTFFSSPLYIIRNALYNEVTTNNVLFFTGFEVHSLKRNLLIKVFNISSTTQMECKGTYSQST